MNFWQRCGHLRAAANLCATVLTQLGQGYGKAKQITKNTTTTLQVSVLLVKSGDLLAVMIFIALFTS